MGVAIPNGNMKEVFETIKTNDYMGWRVCTIKEAQQAADNGIAAIGISEDRIIVLSATDPEEMIVENATVMSFSEISSAYAISELQYYTYSYGTMEYVGTLCIFAANDGSSSSWSTSGHAFLAFKNTSGCPITIGGLTVLAGEEVTFGTWGNKAAHVGIWYNLESYFVNAQGSYGNRVSLSVNITQDDVDLINIMVANNDTWAVLNNCASFATRLWNEVSSVTLDAGTPNTPTSLMSSIKSKTGYEIKRNVQYNINIGYVSNGEFIPVVVSSSAFSFGTVLGRDDHVEFIVPINLNPNSSDMEVW